MFDCRLKQLWPKMAEGSEQPKKLPRQLNLWSEEAMARAVVACLEQKQIGGSHTLRHSAFVAERSSALQMYLIIIIIIIKKGIWHTIKHIGEAG